MIKDIISQNWDSLLMQLLVVFIAWKMVLMACGVDLYFGIKKSRQEGVFKTHSYGLRKTSEKVVWYLGFMFCMLFIDVINPLWIYIDVEQTPIFSIFGAIVLVYTEWKSIREKAGEKFREDLKNNPAEIIQWIKDNKEVVDEILKK